MSRALLSIFAVLLLVVLSVGITWRATSPVDIERFKLFVSGFLNETQINQIQIDIPDLVEKAGNVLEISASPVGELKEDVNYTHLITNESGFNNSVHHIHSSCSRKPAANIAKKTIYQWRDANGKIHFSDQAPREKTITKFQSQRLKSSDKFSLDLNSDKAQLPAFARDRITRDVNTIYRILIKDLAITNVDPIVLKLRLFDEKYAFNAYKKMVAPNMGNAGGFYIGRLREASVFTTSNKKRMYSVVRHEAVHAINHQAFGQSPTWLNEGLAEYFENLEFRYGSHAQTVPNRYQLTILKRSALPFLGNYFQLGGQQWYAEEAKSLRYAIAWSLVTFFLSTNQSKVFFIKMLNTLSSNYCESVDTLAFVNQHYPGGISQLDTDWRKFLSNKHPIHYY